MGFFRVVFLGGALFRHHFFLDILATCQLWHDLIPGKTLMNTLTPWRQHEFNRCPPDWAASGAPLDSSEGFPELLWLLLCTCLVPSEMFPCVSPTPAFLTAPTLHHLLKKKKKRRQTRSVCLATSMCARVGLDLWEEQNNGCTKSSTSVESLSHFCTVHRIFFFLLICEVLNNSSLFPPQSYLGHGVRPVLEDTHR